MQAAPQPVVIHQPTNPVVQHTYMLPQIEALSPPPPGMVLGRSRSQWSTIWRMLGLVLVTFLLVNLLVVIPMGIVENAPDMSFISALCSLPVLLLFIFIRRPRLIHVMLAEPSDTGVTAHPLPGERTLTTPMKTRFRHHLVRDSSLLDIPATKKLWSIFFIAIAISVTLFVMMLNSPDNMLLIQFAILVGIPCWLIGFGVPVFAWMSYSTRSLGLPTRRHEAEAALTAGFVSTLPALFINSVLFPMLLFSIGIDELSTIGEFLILTISAPVGEELCKAAAVLCCYHMIDSPRRGFQVGFTVGLGFAMLENILYITSSIVTGGFAGFAFTAFLRGIGSIPGHAVWTGLSGLGIGWLLSKKPRLGGLLPEKMKAQDAGFILMDSKTGRVVQDATGTGTGATTATGALAMWNLNKYMSTVQYSKDKHWKLPRTPMIGIGLAMLGHAFWNGSSTIVLLVVEKAAGETAAIFALLGWTLLMVTGLLWIGKNIMDSLHSVPSTVDNDFNSD